MTSLKQHLNTQHRLTTLCEKAVRQQIARGDAPATQLRQRRRHLLKALRKHIPQSKRTPEKILHAAVMVLALWGFNGLVSPSSAQAAAVFEHVLLEGVDVGGASKLAFVDIDDDGDLDAFVGEGFGTVKFYRNYSIEDGGISSAPRFVPDVVGNPLDGFDVGDHAAPTFVDIDGDGDQDAFVGELNGAVKFYQNNGTASVPGFVAADGITVINPLAGFDVGGISAPTFVDIDDDGDMDVFVGESGGTVKFYLNDGGTFVATGGIASTGTVVNSLAGVAVGGRAVPTFADIDGDGDMDAFVGNIIGTVDFYQNTGTASAPSFTPADGITIINPLAGFDVGYCAFPTYADIDNDGDLDAFVGADDGSVNFYRNTGDVNSPVFGPDVTINALASVAVGRGAKLTFVDIDGDDDLDAFVGDNIGTVAFYRNNYGIFAADTVNNPLVSVAVAGYASPVFADIDGDADLDVFVGANDGTVGFYLNDGGTFVATGGTASTGTVVNPLALVAVGMNAAPTFVDIDGDDDLDAFVGESGGTVKFYLNDGGTFIATGGTASTGTVANPLDGFDVGFSAAPTFTDIDNDGDLDVFVGELGGTVKFYQNSGSATAPAFVIADGTTVVNPLVGFGVGSMAAPTFVDFDGDGDMDAFIGNDSGKIKFFENLDPGDPVAIDDSATTTENTVLNSTTSLLANDTDINGDTLTAVAGTFDTTQGGSIVISSDGNYTYTPPANFTGTDTADYTVSDGGLTDVGTLTVTVNATASSGGGGGGGAPGLPLLVAMAALLPWRRFRPAILNTAN